MDGLELYLRMLLEWLVNNNQAWVIEIVLACICMGFIVGSDIPERRK